MHRITTFLILAAAAVAASPAAANDGAQPRATTGDPTATLRPLPPVPRPESQVTLYSGYYSASDGFTDRFFAGGFLDRYFGSTGVHADVVYVNREENAAYGALGLSQRINGLGRLKLMAGTSTGNRSILPKLSLHAGLELSLTKDTIVRPSVTYRRFRNDRSHIAPEVQIAHYFGGNAAGYYVAQVDAGLSLTNTDNTGWSLGGGLTNVRKDGLRLGLAGRSGRMAYDSLLGSEIDSRFYGGGPNVGYRFLGGQEIFVRGDVTRNKFYTVTGAFIGFKTAL
ncbi:MAG: hypothetical protein H0T82_08555 [Sphingomonas sp.]|nr:hypothetical protein [Sphingomonas sp.]